MVSGLGANLRDRRDRALLLLGFAGAFRRSELIAINCNDIERNPAGIIVTIRRSKTDQEGQGRRVAIPYAQGPDCPVKALLAWLSASEIREGPIFRPVNRHGRVHARALSGEAVALIVKDRARAAGLDPNRIFWALFKSRPGDQRSCCWRTVLENPRTNRPCVRRDAAALYSRWRAVREQRGGFDPVRL
jgi:integrase